MGSWDADKFTTLLLMADEHLEYRSWDGFEKLIKGAINLDEAEGFSKPFMDRYIALMKGGDNDAVMQALIADQMDNYILGSFAAHRLGLTKELPLIAYAAKNKQLFEGWHGEVSNLRCLMLFGFDVDATVIESGNTALHLMCGLKWGPGVHERAIELLLDAGADCNIKNKNGDTPLTYLAGSFPWTDAVHKTFNNMLSHGANPLIPANDGKNALDILKDNQKNQDKSGGRISVIELIELSDVAAKPKPVRLAPRL